MWGSILSGLGSFGKAIGGGLGKVGKEIGSGIVKGGQKIGGEFKERIGEMREGGGRPAPMTPGFNPGASMPKLGGFRLGQGKPEAPSLGQPSGGNEPPRMPMPALDLKPPMPLTPIQQSGHPPLTGFDTNTGRLEGSPPPRMAPPLTGVNPISGQMDNQPPMIRDSVQITDTAPRLAPSPVPSLAAPQMSAPRDASFDSREGVPLPGRPNRGGTVPYSDYEAGKYDAWAKHAKRDADGNFDPKGGTNRNWKSILQNGLLGAAQHADSGDWGKMLGGAIGGIGGSAVNPQAGYEHVWDAGHGARMMEDQGRQDAQVERQRKQRMGAMDEDYRRAQIDATKRDKLMPVAPGYGLWNAGKGEWEGGVKPEFRPSGQSANAKPRWVQGRLDGKAGWYNLDDPRYANKIIEPFEREKPMTMQEAEADRAAEEGSVESIAMKSYEARGGDNYVMSKMPAPLQQILKNPNPDVTAQLPTEYQQILKNPPKPDDAQGIELLTKAEQARERLEQQYQSRYLQAQNEFQQAKQQQMATDRRWTEDQAKINASKLRRPGGNAPATSGGANGSTAKLSDLKKYLQ